MTTTEPQRGGEAVPARKSKAPAARRPVPMDLAYATLAELCARVDAGEDLDQALVSRFSEAKLDTAEAIDRRIAMLTAIKGQIPEAKAMRDAWAAQAKMLEGLEAAMKAKTKELLEAHPDLPREGTIGRLAIEKNGGVPPLELAFGDKGLSPQIIEMFEVPEQFVRVRTEYELNTDAVRKALEAGESLPWASLGERGTHLAIRAGTGGRK